MSGASGNPTYRVTRRKSMSSTAATNVAAIAAAVKSGGGDFGSGGSRRSMKLAMSSKTSQYGTSPSPSGSLPTGAASFGQSGFANAASKEGTAVVDGPPLATMTESKANAKARIRRASEGSRLSKGEGKRMSAGELRCDKCGKGYKHSSCLTKHLSVPSGRARPLPSHAISVPLVIV